MNKQTRNMPLAGAFIGRKARFWGGIFLLAFSPLAAVAQFNIAQAPLTTGVSPAPNLLYMHDDSGSMYWSFMPDDVFNIDLNANNGYANSAINLIYYDPLVNYPHPPAPPGVVVTGAGGAVPVPAGTLGNADFNAAWFDGYDLAGRNSATANYCIGYNGTITPRRVNLATDYKPTYYYGCYSGYDYEQEYAISTTSAAFYRDGSGTHNINNASSAAAQQNFANWYSYYRTRNYAARAGVARAFDQLDGNVRVGWGRINKTSVQTVDGKNLGRIETGVRPFDDARKRTFMTWLYGVPPTGNTPLKEAVDAAGQYYDRSTTPGVPGPWADTVVDNGTGTTRQAACRKSFTILMTDGYYTGSGALVDNADGTAATNTFTTPARANGTTEAWTKRPFRDDSTNTLADIAWKYWVADLYGDHTNNNIPGTTMDPAWWQHMTTFTIGLGVAGTSGISDAAGKTAAFNAARATPTNLPGTSINWPTVNIDSGDGGSQPVKIDDLLHAAVNGHGDFFSASNADEFVRGMESMINSIKVESAPTAKLARSESDEKNKDKVTGDTLVYEVKLGEDQGGKIFAYGVCISDAEPGCAEKDQIKTTHAWEASSKIVAHDKRNILSWNDDGIDFKWDALSATQRGQLVKGAYIEGDTKPQLNDEKTPVTGANQKAILDYVRGDTSKETGANAFRNRKGSKLGDIYSDPLYFGPSSSRSWETGSDLSAADKSAYTDWKASADYKATPGMLYVGANDGMLHAFNAQTGDEKAAYVPDSVIQKLWRLADPDYGHEFYVDTTPVVNEAQLGKTWNNVLVGTAGAGGRSYFAIDVSKPAALDKARVLWEFKHPELGYNGAGKASINRLKGGEWVAIFGNGYNSDSHKARLFVVKLTDGTLLRAIEAEEASVTPPSSAANPNGLSTPRAFDATPATVTADDDDQDGAVDVVYAGDMRGNLWRFDLSDPKPANWPAPKRILEAKDSTNAAQPITAQPEVARKRDAVRSGIMVYVGTGKFFESSDLTNNQVQSFYGVLDDNVLADIPYSRSNKLVAQTIGATTTEMIGGASRDVNSTSGNDVDYTVNSGFYLDLTAPRERVLTQARVLQNKKASATILVASLLPRSDGADLCNPAANEGYWTELDALSGKKPAKAMLFSASNRVKIGTGTTPIHVGGRGGHYRFGDQQGGACVGPHCDPSPELCGGNMAASGGIALPLLVGCVNKKGRQSWRQIR